MIVIATGFIPLTAVRCFNNGCGKADSDIEKILCGVLIKQEGHDGPESLT